MNWKTEAMDKLKRYEAMRASLESLPAEIARLEQEARCIRDPQADGTEGKDALLTNRVCRQELEDSLAQAKLWVAAADKALAVLSGEERHVLDRFYIHPEKGAADGLAGELWVDIKTVYRRKDDALRKFTIALYGGVEN